jgi:asparagine synthase (glutamine-hydrolysing)
MTSDPAYISALQSQIKDLLSQPNHQAFDLLRKAWLTRVAGAKADLIDFDGLLGMELALDLYHWCDIYRPSFELDS